MFTYRRTLQKTIRYVKTFAAHVTLKYSAGSVENKKKITNAGSQKKKKKKPCPFFARAGARDSEHNILMRSAWLAVL